MHENIFYICPTNAMDCDTTCLKMIAKLSLIWKVNYDTNKNAIDFLFINKLWLIVVGIVLVGSSG